MIEPNMGKGYVVYGPYAVFEQGEYILEIEIKAELFNSNEPILYYDIPSNVREIISKGEILSDSFPTKG
jgi:hypothetical protein